MNRKKFLRACGKWTDIIPVAVFISVLLVIGGTLISGVLEKILPVTKLLDLVTGDPDISVFLGQYVSTFGVWVLVLPLILLVKNLRPMKQTLGYNRRGNTVKGALIGLALGFGANGLCAVIALLSGDIKLSFGGFRPLLLLVFLIAIMIQSGSEELIERLYLYQSLRRRYRNPLVAILINSLAFMAMHVFNPGFTLLAGLQIFSVGIVFSLLVYYYDSLWAAITFHTAWNFTQNIFFGLPNSGIVSAYSLFRLEAASARNGLFYNVDFGIEGSIGASLVLILIALGIFLLNRGKGERKDIWEEEDRLASSICPYCGEAMKETDVFCPSCGKKR